MLQEGGVSEWLVWHEIISTPPPPTLRLSALLSQAIVRTDEKIAVKALRESAFQASERYFIDVITRPCGVRVFMKQEVTSSFPHTGI